MKTKYIKITIILILILLIIFLLKKDEYKFNSEKEIKIIESSNLESCIKTDNFKVITLSTRKGIDISSTGVAMKYILSNLNLDKECILNELQINNMSNENEIIQRVSSYITYKTSYISDEKEKTEGVSIPSLFIKRKGGDCEDKAMFALSIFNEFDFNIKILHKKPTLNKEGHIALKINNFIFNPYDFDYEKIYDIKEIKNDELFIEYDLKELQEILDDKNMYKIENINIRFKEE